MKGRQNFRCMHCTCGMVAANHNFAHRHGCSLHVPVPVRSHSLRTSVVKVRKSQLSLKRAHTMNWKSRKIVTSETLQLRRLDCHRIRLSQVLVPSIATEDIHRTPTRSYTCGASTLTRSGSWRSSYHQLQSRKLEHQRDTPIATIRLLPDLTLWRASSYCQLRAENFYSTSTRYTTTLLMPSRRISLSRCSYLQLHSRGFTEHERDTLQL